MPILYEDRSVLAIDKAAGWMLVPFNWQHTQFNLQAAIASAIGAGYFWSRSRNLKFLKYIHRLDAETTGILLFGKNLGAVDAFGSLFETRRMRKRYLAVVDGVPRHQEWVCEAPLASEPGKIGRMVVDRRRGKQARTTFRVLETRGNRTLVEACPVTGRTHQIRVHLLYAGHPVAGDPLYSVKAPTPRSSRPAHNAVFPIGLRAVELSYRDPFRHTPVVIQASVQKFLSAFGFQASAKIGSDS